MTQRNKNTLIISIVIASLLFSAFVLINAETKTHPLTAVGFFGQNGVAEQVCNVWCNKLFAFVLVSFAGAIGYAFYSYHVIKVTYEHELRKAEIEATRKIVNPPSTRIIPVNSVPSRRVSNGLIQLTDDLVLSKNALIEFLSESIKPNGIGLTISKWKLERGWDQTTVEKLLDYLAKMQIITPRSNGRACEYLDKNISVIELLKKISLSF